MKLLKYLFILLIGHGLNDNRIEGLNLISLYENWDVMGTGVIYYHQIMLQQELIKQKSTVI